MNGLACKYAKKYMECHLRLTFEANDLGGHLSRLHLTKKNNAYLMD